MSKKEIQEERVKRYFIESGKKIIRGEGIAAFNVRNVADEAGYSSATLYNYFKDVSEIMNICILEFIDEVRVYVEENSTKSQEPRETIVSKSWAYAKFFVQYPGIFELLYLEKRSVIGYNQEISEKMDEIIPELLAKEFDEIFIGKHQSDSSMLKKMFCSMLNGFLLMYINKRIPSDFNEFHKMYLSSTERFLDLSW